MELPALAPTLDPKPSRSCTHLFSMKNMRSCHARMICFVAGVFLRIIMPVL